MLSIRVWLTKAIRGVDDASEDELAISRYVGLTEGYEPDDLRGDFYNYWTEGGRVFSRYNPAFRPSLQPYELIDE